MKVDVNLKGVPQTLLLPLISRAYYSQGATPFLDDRQSRELVQSMNYDFGTLSKKMGSTAMLGCALRTYYFDEILKKYISNHPKVTIVSLGAGLDTAFYRLDNNKLTWVDIDFPEVIDLRKKILPNSMRTSSIAKSVLDFSWVNEVKLLNDDFFFIAGGLLMYLPEEMVKSLIVTLANHFPNTNLLFDTFSTRSLKYANRLLKQANMESAPLQWGFDGGKEIENWSPKIKFQLQKNYLLSGATFNIPLLSRFKVLLYGMIDKSSIIHLKFKN